MGSYSDQIKAHVEEAITLLQLAKKYLENNEYEAVASHAYKSAFHTASALLLDEDIGPERHGDVITLLQEVFVNGRRLTKEQVANLSWLFALRNAADRDVSPIQPEDAHRAAEIAESFFEAARVILEG